MPLLKRKSEKAFVHNLKAELHAGKPREQALAIAYSVKRRAKKANGGEVCKECQCSPCSCADLAHGGSVYSAGHWEAPEGYYNQGDDEYPKDKSHYQEKRADQEVAAEHANIVHQKGVHHPLHAGSGRSFTSKDKGRHKQKHSELQQMNKKKEMGKGYPKHFAHGGMADANRRRGAVAAGKYGEKQAGVHNARMPYPGNKESYGESYAGYSGKAPGGVESRTGKPVSRQGMQDESKKEHRRVLGEMKSMPKKYPKHFAPGGFIEEEEASGYVDHEGDDVRHNAMAMHEDDRMLNQHGEEEEGPQGAWMASGGFIGSHQDASHDMDMVGRIMKQRQRMYSKGGRVANDDHAFEYEFEEPNDFDDLARRDDLEFEYTGANSGDEKGNAGEDARRHDIVMKAMMRRRKQRNPSPEPQG